jgi:DedD protein
VNRLLDTNTDLREDSHATGDHEISLGVPTILGIFFALALAFGAVFGFGYTLGRKSAQNAAIAPANGLPNGASITVKPSAGSLANQPAAAHPVATATDTPAPAGPAASVTVPLAASKNGVLSSDTIIAGEKPSGGSVQPVANNPQPAISPTGTFMVQIAAVSSQQIADIELAALKKYGYDVAVRHEPQDQLLHIQIGPFATRKDADAMRDNVQAHGFNAIVK